MWEPKTIEDRLNYEEWLTKEIIRVLEGKEYESNRYNYR